MSAVVVSVALVLEAVWGWVLGAAYARIRLEREAAAALGELAPEPTTPPGWEVPPEATLR